MFRFDRDQISYGIGGIDVGGQPGSRRTLLVGSLFYPGHRIVSDRSTGIVDNDALSSLISRLEEASDVTGTPHALSLFAETPAAISRHIDDVVEIFDGPIMVDSPSSDVRVAGIQRTVESGLTDQVVLNSVGISTTDAEVDAIPQVGPFYAIALAFDPGSPDLRGRIHLLDDGGDRMDKGLLDACGEWGVTPLVDVAVTSMGDGAGEALRAIPICKAKWGLPTGCCLLNALESWDMATWLREGGMYPKVASASIVAVISAGADWVMYGPAEWGRDSMAVASFIDGLQEGMFRER